MNKEKQSFNLEKKLILSSSNDHKKDEIESILGITLLSPRDFGIDIEIDEVGNSFVENAILKAVKMREHFKELKILEKNMVFLSDDSGICIRAFGFGPGIYSKRYGSTSEVILSFKEKNELILKEMQGITDRYAYFICAAVLLFSEKDFLVSSGSLEGNIGYSAIEGIGGFAYDKIFIPEGETKTISELGNDIKKEISHRQKAFSRLKIYLNSCLDS